MTKIFQQPLWGYELDLPEGWHHRRLGNKDGFTPDPRAFQTRYEGETLAQLLIQGEWNSLRKPTEQLWTQHLGRTSLLLGAKNIGTARWKMTGAVGYEAEIVLPKRNRQRMWAGMLEKEELVLEFFVLHWKEKRKEMEPLISKIISSLRLIPSAENLEWTPEEIPLPPDSRPIPPTWVIDDIQDADRWRAYQGFFPPGALQAFYLRELPHSEWTVTSYIPFPNRVGLPFAYLKLKKEGETQTLGLLPGSEDQPWSSIVIKRS